MPAFLWQTFLAQRQARRAHGFVGGSLLADARRTFWTLTAWKAESDMRAFRGSQPHAGVMPQLREWCDEAAYAHWTAIGETVPPWPEAHARLISDGRLSLVTYPSANHTARQFATPRLSPYVGKALKPSA